MRNRVASAFLLLLVAVTTVIGQTAIARVPAYPFARYPADGLYTGKPAQPKLATPIQREFRTVLRNGDQHVSEQPVKGSKLPNVTCILPGSSDKVIIVGAHFDRVSEGDGVVDNWSGASLLPSLYEGVKIEPRKHTYVFIGFTDEEQGEVGSHFYANK